MYVVLRDDFDAPNRFYGIFADFHLATAAIQDNVKDAVKLDENSYGIMPRKVQPLNPDNNEVYYGIIYHIYEVHVDAWDEIR